MRNTITILAGAIATLAITSLASAAEVHVGTGRINTIATFSNVHEYDQAVTFRIDGGAECAGKNRYAIDSSGGKNDKLVSMLYSAYLSGRQVRVGVDDEAPLIGGRCQVVYLRVYE